MAIKINDGGITERLEKIRKDMGAEKVPFVPRPPTRRIEIKLDGERIQSLFHPSELLIKDNRPVFAYIRDNYFAGFLGNLSSDNPWGRSRIHFTVCQTLQQMKNKGRWDRYRITNRDDDLYYIDTGKGEKEARLYPCKHCLNKVAYQCFNRHLSRGQQNKIVESFNAKEALDLLWQQFDIFKEQASSLASAGMPAGYAPNQAGISRAYRASKGYICEKCGVNLKHAQHCADTHHIGDKNNNRYKNLQCLCKLCHAREHPHYRPSEECRQIIERARREQGITTA